MPDKVYNLSITIDAKNNASPKLKQAGQDMSSFGKAAKDVFGAAGIQLGVAGLASAAIAAAGAMTKLAMDAEQTKVAFTTLIGSAAGAQEHLDELRAFAASTPFQFNDLTEASKKMQAFGFESERVIPMMTAIGDAVSAMGGGSAQIDRVTLALGQMSAKGKVQAGEMLQLTEAGIPAWRYLADAIGVSTAEVQKMSERGLIPAGDAINYILEGMEKDFGGMMAKQAETAAGKLSNLTDKLTALGTSVGSILLPGTEAVIDVTSDAVDGFSNLTKVSGILNIMIQKSVGIIDEEQAALRAAALAGGDLTAVYTEQIPVVDQVQDSHDRLAATTQVNVAGSAEFAAQTATLNTVWQSYGPTVSEAVAANEALRQTLIPLTGAASDLKFGMGELTTTNLFYAASEGLSAEQAYEMARGMGLISDESAAAKSALDELRTQYESGQLSSAGYTTKTSELAGAIERLQSKKITVTVDAIFDEIRNAAISAQVDAAGAGGGEVVIEGHASGGPFSAGGAIMFNESPATAPEVIVTGQSGGYVLTKQDAQAALAGAYGRGGNTYNVSINDQLAAKLFLEEVRRREMSSVDGMM